MAKGPEFKRYKKEGSPDRLAYTAEDEVNAKWDGFVEETEEQAAEREAADEKARAEAAKAAKATDKERTSTAGSGGDKQPS